MLLWAFLFQRTRIFAKVKMDPSSFSSEMHLGAMNLQSIPSIKLSNVDKQKMFACQNLYLVELGGSTIRIVILNHTALNL